MEDLKKRILETRIQRDKLPKKKKKNKNVINAKTRQDVMDVNMLEVSYIIVNNKENAKW
jgi:hypothetical protein